MKKLFNLVFTAVFMLLAVTSCSQEEDFTQSSQQTTSFNISLNGAVGSRAIGKGTYANKLYYEVFMDGGSVDKGEVLFSAGPNHNLDLPLLNGETYSIVFWAQNSNCSIYNLNNLSEIKVNYDNDVLANQESYDAFYNALVNFKADGNTHRVELRRPFAQLNLGTGDWDKVIVPDDADPVTVTSVKVEGLADTFAPLTGEASGSVTKTFDYSALPEGTFKVNNKEYKYLSLNYLLVPGTKEPHGTGVYVAQTNEDKATVNLTFNLKRGDKELQPISVPNAPLQRNWRTNIIGDVLTGTDFDIVIKSETDGENNSIDILKEVLINGGECILMSDLTLNEDLTIPAGITAKIDLNGHNLNLDNSTIKNEGNLIIESGVINVKGDHSIGLLLCNDNNATSLNISDAVINAIEGAAAIIPYKNSTAEINFNNSELNVNGGLGGIYGDYWADDLKINLYSTTIKGKNGLYVNAKNAEVLIDEKSSASEFNMTGGNLLVVYAGEKPVVKDVNSSSPSVITYKQLDTTTYEGIYAVQGSNREYNVISAEGLKNLNQFLPTLNLNEAQTATINLTADIDLAGTEWTPITSMWFTFNGNGYTIKNLNVSKAWKAGLFGYAGAVTINDLTIENANVTGAQTGIFAAAGEGLKVNNCFLKGTNKVTWAACNTSQGTLETWNGIGAITGVLQGSNVNVTIVEGTTVALIKTGFSTDDACKYVDNLIGYIQPNNGTITNNGIVTSVVNVSNDSELNAAISHAWQMGEVTIVMAEGTYSNDITFIAPDNYVQSDNIVFKAAEGANVVYAGTAQLGLYERGTFNVKAWNANVTFEGITFDHAEPAKHSLNVQNMGILTLKDCMIIGDGEYGIGSVSGANVSPSRIIDCTFKNAAMQVVGNFGTGLVIDNCIFNESRVNVQGGNSVTVQNCKFNNTLTSTNVGDSFYLVRSNSTPITVKNSEININSDLTDVAASQAKWGILWNRGTTNWTVENVAVTMTEAAMEQTELLVTKCTSTGVINTNNLTVNSKVYASTKAQLEAAINNGATDIVLAGEIVMPNNGSSNAITFSSLNGTATIDNTKGSWWDGATLTFNNIKFKTSTGMAGSDYAALYSTNVTYNECSFSGPMRLGRDGAKFNGCTFNDLGADYIWTGGNDATFEGCTFNTRGKALLIYSDGGNEVSKVSVTGCTFNATQGAKASAIANQYCAAIEIHNYGNGVNLTTSGNTIDDDFSGVWRIKTYEAGKPKVIVNGTEYNTIAIDGKTMTIDGNRNVTVNE